ncbi:MAG: VCBS repeat-containing protein [Planctomycetia bacterium]|nr:VCBS repeat-containing protein [Planctomycetia bacterium]
MYARSWLLLPLGLCLCAVPAGGADEPATPIGWKKTVIEKKFRAEGVAVADVNKDGKLDILVGDVWYEAPDWKVHEIRKPGDYKDGSGGYSQCFACWADDLNGDGWADLVVIGFPGAPCHWYENPQNKAGHWKQHVICKSACNETPQYVDLFGKGQRALVMGFEDKQMVWVAPGKDPTQPWEVHAISEPGKPAAGSQKFAHGLGVGDVNGDGKLDVIVPQGWYEQPAKDDSQSPWKFHPAGLGAACADMYAYDLDGDGKADVISSSAHNYGIWSYLQKVKDGAEPNFVKKDLFPKLFSQSHAMNLLDVNGDGQKDFVTGKRWWAHGPKGDVDPNDPAVLYWFEAKKSKDGIVEFTPHKIDDDSGIGTQFWTGDFNGDKLPDIVVANKKGVFLIEQVRKP